MIAEPVAMPTADDIDLLPRRTPTPRNPQELSMSAVVSSMTLLLAARRAARAEAVARVVRVSHSSRV
jgi:hypothetical protein